jgi:hypothetical protein
MRAHASWALWLMVIGCSENEDFDAPPELVSPRITVRMPEDGEVTIDATAVDGRGEKLTYTTTAPRHGVVTGKGPTYTYVPATDYFGPDALMVSISDGQTTLMVSVDITIIAVEDAPVAADVQVATTEDHGVAVPLDATDVDTATLSYSVVLAPAHGALSGVAPSFMYTPLLHYTGTDSFTYAASDGSLTSNVATATIVIGSENH